MAVASAALIAGSLVTISGGEKAAAQGTGSALLTETFQGTSVADPNWVGLDDACLTGATSPPTGAESNLGPCGQLDSGSPPLGTAPGYLRLTDNQFIASERSCTTRPCQLAVALISRSTRTSTGAKQHSPARLAPMASPFSS